MKFMLARLFVVLSLCCISTLSALADQDTLTVTGRGSIKQKADIAYITLYSRASGMLLSDAQKKQDAAVEGIKKALQEADKSLSDISVRISRISEKGGRSSFMSEGDQSLPPEIESQIRISLPPNREHIAKLIDAAVRAGASLKSASDRWSSNDNGAITYGLKVETATSGYRQALEKALQDAHSEATVASQLLKRNLGEVHSLSCSHGTSVTPCSMFNAQSNFESEFVGADPEIQVSAQVGVSYELKPATP